MSREALDYAWAIQSLPPATKIVLVALADHANSSFICWPSQETLSEECSMSIRTIVRHVGKLIDCGFITKRKGRFNNSNIYEVNIDKLEEEGLPVLEARRLRRREKRQKCQSVTSDTGDTSKSVTGDTLTEVEQSIINHKSSASGTSDDNSFGVSKTKDPCNAEYVFTEEEKKQIVDEWNRMAKGKFRGLKILADSHQRNIKKSYVRYKSYHDQGHFTSPLKSKFEWLMTTIHAFDNWVTNKVNNPSFYMKSPTKRADEWVAHFGYMVRASTFDKMVSNDE